MPVGNKIRAEQIATDFISPTDVTLELNTTIFGTDIDSNKNKSLYKFLTNIELNKIQPDYIKKFKTDKIPEKLSFGYSVEIFTKIENNFERISTNFYDFDYFSGILVFNSKLSDEQLNKYVESGIFITAFQYIGKKVVDYFMELELLIAKANDAIQKVKDESIAIQPIKFSTASSNMEKSKSLMKLEELPEMFNENEHYFREYQIDIPGYCWQITYDENKIPYEIGIDTDKTSINQINGELYKKKNSLIITDIIYDNQENKTKIIFCLDAFNDINNKYDNTYIEKPLLGFDNLNNPICYDLNFIATTFTYFNGQTINLLSDKILQ